MSESPVRIGVLDSGIGGLSVLREIHRLLPDHPSLYVGDQANLPYGPRPAAEVQSFVEGIARFLIGQGAAVIVLACNAASAAGLLHLRQIIPHVPFVGMEPAVKPAVEATRSGVVGVLTTRTTAAGALYQRVLERYAGGVQVITRVAPELVTIAEYQTQHTVASRAIIASHLEPLLAAGADQIVLACTHFPFLADVIRELAGPDVTLVDPAPAVARQVTRIWPADLFPANGPHQYFTTGDPARFEQVGGRLLGQTIVCAHLGWGETLRLPQSSHTA